MRTSGDALPLRGRAAVFIRERTARGTPAVFRAAAA